MGGIEWSPQIQKARDRIRYYVLSRRKLLKRKVSASILYKLSKKTGCNAIGLDRKALDKLVDEAFTFYKSLRKQSAKLREDHLESLAKALSKKAKVKSQKL